MELKVKQLRDVDKIALDTQVQGCWSDCHTGEYRWEEYNGLLKSVGADECHEVESMSWKTNPFL